MPEPKVYDAKGNRLKVDDLAKSRRFSGELAISHLVPCGSTVSVRARSASGRTWPFTAFRLPCTEDYCCADLQLIKDTKEENGGT